MRRNDQHARFRCLSCERPGGGWRRPPMAHAARQRRTSLRPPPRVTRGGRTRAFPGGRDGRRATAALSERREGAGLFLQQVRGGARGTGLESRAPTPETPRGGRWHLSWHDSHPRFQGQQHPSNSGGLGAVRSRSEGSEQGRQPDTLPMHPDVDCLTPAAKPTRCCGTPRRACQPRPP